MAPALRMTRSIKEKLPFFCSFDLALAFPNIPKVLCSSLGKVALCVSFCFSVDFFLLQGP